jgi:hypothetical protein
MEIEQSTVASRNTPWSIQPRTPEPANPKAVLQELFVLLEEYGPVWYTEEHRRHAVAALLCAQWPASRLGLWR